MPDYPSTLSGVVLWVDGRATAYSDTAATVPATAYAGRVRRIDQVSPASGSVTAASAAARPYRELTALNFQVGGAHAMAAPISAAVTQDAVTIAINFTMRDNFPGGPQLLLSNGTTLQVLTFSDNLITLKYNGGTNWFVSTTGPTVYARATIGSQVTLTLRTTGAALSASVVVDGTRIDYALAVSVASTSLPGASWLLGWDGVSAGAELHGAIAQAIVVNRAISNAENDALITWLLANPAPYYCPASVPIVVVTGDSIARGFGLEANRSAIWSYLAQESLNATQTINLVNAAISGAGIQNQRDAYPVTMGPWYDATRSRNIFVGAIGTNDMATLNKDGPTTLADYYSYMDLAKAAGFRIVACTVLPRSGTGHDAAFNTARAFFNAAVRADWAGRGYSAIADVASISGMGAVGDELNTTYYQDNIHPTFAGDALMAPVYSAAIQAALGSSTLYQPRSRRGPR